MTKAMPLSGGMRSKNSLIACNPPAEAPIPTIGKLSGAAILPPKRRFLQRPPFVAQISLNQGILRRGAGLCNCFRTSRSRRKLNSAMRVSDKKLPAFLEGFQAVFQDCQKLLRPNDGGDRMPARLQSPEPRLLMRYPLARMLDVPVDCLRGRGSHGAFLFH